MLDSFIEDSLNRYARDHCPTGSFLRAVLENDLREAFGRADDNNRYIMFDIVCYCWNQLPAECWGSKENVAKWLGE